MSRAVLVAFCVGVITGPLAAQEKRGRKYLGKPLATWARRLQSEKRQERQDAYDAIRLFGAAGKAAAVPVLVGMLDDLNAEYAIFACEKLGEFGPLPESAIIALAQATKQPNDSDVRKAAVKAAGKLGPQGAAAVPALVSVIRDKDRVLGWTAVWALAELGPPAAGAIPDLQKAFREAAALDGPNAPPFRDRIVVALGKIGPDAVPALLELFAGERELRPYIAVILGGLGSKAKAAVPALLKGLQDERIPTRAECAWALWQIERHPAGVSTLVALLTADWQEPANPGAPKLTSEPNLPDKGNFHEAAMHYWEGGELMLKLAEIGPAAKAALPALEKIVADGKPWRVYPPSAWALWKIGRHKAAVPALLKCLVYYAPDPGAPPRPNWQVLGWLEEMGPEARAAVPGLLKLLDGQVQVGANRQSIIQVVGKIDPEAAKGLAK